MRTYIEMIETTKEIIGFYTSPSTPSVSFVLFKLPYHFISSIVDNKLPINAFHRIFHGHLVASRLILSFRALFYPIAKPMIPLTVAHSSLTLCAYLVYDLVPTACRSMIANMSINTCI